MQGIVESQTTPQNIAYYITPHGFGHAVRSIEVIKALLALRPDLSITVVSTIPSFLIEQHLKDRVLHRQACPDVGLVQLDSIRFDLEATLVKLEVLHQRSEPILAEEESFLRRQQIGGVVCDVPFLPLAAASCAEVPAIGLGNFTWDWIYRAYAEHDTRWRPIVSWIEACYQRCDLFLQLPMHGDSTACPNVVDVPLVARPAALDPEIVRKKLGLNQHAKAYLVSFTELNLDRAAAKRLESIRDTFFLYMRPLHYDFANSVSLDHCGIPYSDIVAAVDGVITKPGYGILADCLAHGTPMVYSDRGFFPEYPILVDEIEEKLANVHLPSADLYAGNWEAALRKLEAQPRRRPEMRLDGSRVCAELILRHLKWRSCRA